MAESHKRSVVKAIGYKGGSVAVLALTTWLFTRDLLQMTLITGCYQILSALGYYVYERIWNRLKWGRCENK